MEPTEGEAVQRSLWQFLECAANEDKPTNEGWLLFHALERAVENLGDTYESLGPQVPEPQLPKEYINQPRYDNWFVDIFDSINDETWNRQPGDRLTFNQKFDIVGQIFLTLLVVGLVVVGAGYLVLHLQEWEIGRHG